MNENGKGKGKGKGKALVATWVLYLLGGLSVFFLSGDALLVTAPIGLVFGIISFVFAAKVSSYRAWYIVTGLVGVIPVLLLAFYIWALGSGWRN